jgi:hypothetical protein
VPALQALSSISAPKNGPSKAKIIIHHLYVDILEVCLFFHINFKFFFSTPEKNC